MTQTLTTEQLNEMVDGNWPESGSSDVMKAMARELLANREPQPVGVIRHVATGVHASLFGPLPEGTELFTAPPAPAVASCETAEMGSYSGQTAVHTPTGKLVGIDHCLLDEITGLWRMGVTTIECCCGHSVTTGYIAVDESSIDLMEQLGYQHEIRDDDHPCFFIPKTPRHKPVPPSQFVNPEFTGAPAVPDDTRRMNWLVSHHVAVRQPLVYGSHAMFTAQQVSDDHEEHKTDLREQIDAAMLAAAPEGGNG